MKRCTGIVALCLFGAACDLEFLGPESPTEYDVLVNFTDRLSTRATIRATLSPGFTADGEERKVADDAILVWNQTLVPIGRDEAGVRTYELTVDTDPRELPNPLVVTRPPTVGGASFTRDLSLPLVWRAGPEAIAVPRDQDLVLRVVNAAGLDSTAEGTVWSLVLRAGQEDEVRTIFRTASLGLPPEEVVVPATTLAIEEPVLRAELEASYLDRSEMFRAFSNGDLVYEAELRVSAHLFWTLSLQGDPN